MTSHRKPRVSIGVPVHNGEHFIREALESLLAQTYTDFELIIADNASNDRTEEVCREYVAKDQRVRYYRSAKNIGLGGNFNRAFELATGEYFKWASADDVCHADLLARCIDVLDRESNVVLAHSKTGYIDTNGTPVKINDPGWDLRSELPAERLRYVIRAGHLVNPHYGLIRADALAHTRLMPSYPGGDYRLLAELSLKGKFVEIPEYLFFRRVHPGASSQNTAKVMWTMDYHSGGTGHVFLPFWDLSIDHFITIIGSGLSADQKLCLLIVLLRGMWWQHKRLLEELRVGISSCWTRVGGRVVRR